MNIIVKYIIALFVGTLLGNLFISIQLSRYLFNKDIRDVGSGNPGATNMARQNGLVAGIITLLFDVLKSFVSVYIGWKLCGIWGVMFAGLGCITGHCYPILHHFAGGKGIAVGVVICFAISWVFGLCVVAAFIIGVLISKKVSVGSVCGALTIILLCIFISTTPLPLRILGIYSGILATFRHKENIKRIFAGTEPNFTYKKFNKK